MSRLILTLLIAGMLAAAASCDKGGREPETAKTDAAKGEEKPSFYPEAGPYNIIQGAVLDTLVAKKKRFKITRDQYWEDEGGVLANDYLEVWYPAGRTTVTHGMYVFEEMMPARKKYAALFGSAPSELLVIRIADELKPYQEETGREWWYYSEMKGDTLIFVPVYTLYKRGISPIAVPHEYYQWAIRKTTRHGAPRWLEEGMASRLSGEGDLLLNQAYEFKTLAATIDSPERIEEILQGEKDRGETRIAYFRAYRMVEKLVDTFGEEKLRDALVAIGEGRSLDDAFMQATGKSYADILEIASDYEVDLTRKK